jgi:hypothetical protein
MEKKTFFISLAILTLSLVLVSLILNGKGEIGKFTDFSLMCIGAFVSLSIGIYYLGVQAINSANKYSFNNLVVINMILKMIVSVLIILIYKQINEVESRGFIIPFLVIYLSYTIFETYFLTKLAKQSV